MDADEMSFVRGRPIFAGAVEPAEEHVGVGAGGDELHLAARLQATLQVERPDAVGVVAVVAAAPEAAAHLSGLAPRVARLRAEAEVVRADLLAILERDA